MSLYTLTDAHPLYDVPSPQRPSQTPKDRTYPDSLKAASLKNPSAKSTSLNNLDPYQFQHAPSWYTSPRGPPYHSRALETFQSNMDHTSINCESSHRHLMLCSSCRKQALLSCAGDFAFYFVLGLALIYASKRI